MNDREKVINGIECCLEGLCDRCQYKNSDGPGGCKDELMVDALSALKEQEPRVMTLEEVRAAEVVWLEQCGVCVCAIKIQNFDSGIMSFAYEYNNYTSFVNIKPEYYGIISRCWTAKPTEEQRKAGEGGWLSITVPDAANS